MNLFDTLNLKRKSSSSRKIRNSSINCSQHWETIMSPKRNARIWCYSSRNSVSSLRPYNSKVEIISSRSVNQHSVLVDGHLDSLGIGDPWYSQCHSSDPRKWRCDWYLFFELINRIWMTRSLNKPHWMSLHRLSSAIHRRYENTCYKRPNRFRTMTNCYSIWSSQRYAVILIQVETRRLAVLLH